MRFAPATVTALSALALNLDAQVTAREGRQDAPKTEFRSPMVLESDLKGFVSLPEGKKWRTTAFAGFRCEDVALSELVLTKRHASHPTKKLFAPMKVGLIDTTVRLDTRPSQDRRVTLKFELLHEGAPVLEWELAAIEAEEGKRRVAEGVSKDTPVAEFDEIFKREPPPTLRVTMTVSPD